ncbi:MAG: hypothetical protein JWN78_618 [Bacteroidota bacterium]|nr:hypothetical protein [Bacteroidota bacterium]
MKNLFVFILLGVIFTSNSCKKHDTSFNDIPAAKSTFDNSNYGIYKGVFVGSSGIIIIDVNNGNTISATLKIDGTTYNFTTTQTISQNQSTTINFTNGNNSFTFTVYANGSNPTITNLDIDGHPNAAILVVKETSTVLVKCFEGSYNGDDDGTFNAVIYGNIIKAIVRSSYDDIYYANGTVNNNQISASGTVNTGAEFHGTLNGNSFSGTWNNTDYDYHGNWSGSRTY